MKEITLTDESQIEMYIESLVDAANEAQMRLMDIAGNHDGLMLLEKMKFEQVGCDPLEPERSLNLIEQVNQTFTYLASFKAAELLFAWHNELRYLNLNLGTKGGSDIESSDCDGIAAEIFAATSPASNSKLSKDVKKVRETDAHHQYVFFLCPGVSPGRYKQNVEESVTVWSLEF